MVMSVLIVAVLVLVKVVLVSATKDDVLCGLSPAELQAAAPQTPQEQHPTTTTTTARDVRHFSSSSCIAGFSGSSVLFSRSHVFGFENSMFWCVVWCGGSVWVWCGCGCGTGTKKLVLNCQRQY